MARKLTPPMVRWAGGVQIVGTRIWCDAQRSGGVCFLSGADVALRGRGKVITTERTAQLLGLDALVTPYARPFAVGRARLELLPAGRLPGSAQLRVEIDGRAVIYAGRVSLQPSRLAEPAQIRGCDELVVDAPAACQSLPARAEVEARLVEEVRATLGAGETAVVTVARDWMALEAAALLAVAGVTVGGHARIRARAAAYRRAGLPLPALKTRAPVMLWPLGAEIPHGHRIDLALADGLDRAALLELVRATGARDVRFLSGLDDSPDDPVTRGLKEMGVRAHRLAPPEQIRLL